MHEGEAEKGVGYWRRFRTAVYGPGTGNNHPEDNDEDEDEEDDDLPAVLDKIHVCKANLALRYKQKAHAKAATVAAVAATLRDVRAYDDRFDVRLLQQTIKYINKLKDAKPHSTLLTEEAVELTFALGSFLRNARL